MKTASGAFLRYIPAIVIVAVYAALYAWCFDPKLDLNGDNATYISLARNLASGKGYSDLSFGGNYQPAVQFPPGYPFILSMMVRLGLDSLVAFKILNGIFLILSVLLVFFLMRGITGKTVFATVTALLCVTAPRLLKFSMIAMSEMSYMFCICLAFFAMWRCAEGKGRWNVWFWIACIFAAASYYIRGNGLSIMFAVVVFFLFRKEWVRAAVSVGVEVILILPWMIRGRIVGSGSRYLDTVLVNNPWRPDDRQIESIGDFLKKAWLNLYDTTLNGFRCILFPGTGASWDDYYSVAAIIIGVLILALVVYGLWNMKPLHFAFLAFLLANTAFLMAWHSGNDYRYVTPYIPMVIAGFWYGVWCLLERFAKKPWPAVAVCMMALVPILLSLPKLKDAHQVGQSGYSPEYSFYFDLADKIEALNPDPGTVSPVAICCRKPELFSYHAPSFYCCNYPYTPDTEEMARFFIDRKVGFVVLDMLGYSSTERYLIPALGGMLDLLTTMTQGDDGSVVFAFDLLKAEERYGTSN
ncbi:MAG: glycosyltransferase family 39 protein [Bacteroidales bacterium]|nr:glycosyltransferase family 39 protein [Bacteroidales bacterium]